MKVDVLVTTPLFAILDLVSASAAVIPSIDLLGLIGLHRIVSGRIPKI